MRRWAPAALLVGCQPGPLPVDVALECGERPDTVVARPVMCAADVPPGGDGRVGDTLIAGPELRVIVRNPMGALTTLGVGGGTVIDAAPWDSPDLIHEIVPLVRGAWVTDVSLDLVDGTVLASGTPAALPEIAAELDTASVAVTWSIDGPWLRAEGAEELLVRVQHDALDEGTRLVGDGVTVATDAAVDTTDGLRRVASDRVLVAPSAHALSILNPQGRRVSGEAFDATALELLADDAIIATVPVTRDFDFRVPGEVDGVRAVAPGREPSTRERPGPGLSLVAGPTGTVRVEPVWVDRAHPIRVTWTADGRRGAAVLDPSGDVVQTGPGSVVLAFDGGPTLEADVPRGGQALVEPELDGLTTDRLDVGWRGGEHADAVPGLADRAALDHAGADGLGLVVLLGDNAVASEPDDAPAHLPESRTGARLALRGGGELIVWPLAANDRRRGFGAPEVVDLPVEDAIAAAGADRRRVAVDLATLAALGPPAAVAPRPTHVAMSAPDAGGPLGDAWAPYWEWVDAGVPIVPVGTRTLVAVGDPDSSSGTDAEVAWVRGRVMASSGPEAWLTVGDAGPGEIVGDRDGLSGPFEATHAHATVELPGPWREQARAALVVDGELHVVWRAVDAPPTLLVPARARWVSLVVWEPGGAEDAAWALTAPVWINPPG